MSDIFAVDQGDPRRIAAAVVTGVGFLGAGMIMRHQGAVISLTTAATAWLVAALGMGIGMGKYIWRAYGRPEDHIAAMLTFRDDQEISEFIVA